LYARYSPDGQTIYVTSTSGTGSFLARVSASGGELAPLTDDAGDDRYSQPSRDGRRLYFFSSRGEESRNIWVLSLEDGAMRPVTDFYGRRGRMPSDALAVGDGYIYFTWADATGDLWVMDVVTGDE
jgi:Tol biopolymer transport system component